VLTLAACNLSVPALREMTVLPPFKTMNALEPLVKLMARCLAIVYFQCIRSESARKWGWCGSRAIAGRRQPVTRVSWRGPVSNGLARTAA
jgi:hypothetical protein